MVRTYPFNPSTQCFLDSLPGVSPSFMPTLLPLYNVPSRPLFRNEQSEWRKAHLRPQHDHIAPTSLSLHTQPPAIPQLNTFAAEGGSAEVADMLYGVRSVMINGQRYYRGADSGSEELGEREGLPIASSTLKAPSSLFSPKSNNESMLTTLKAFSTNDLMREPYAESMSRMQINQRMVFDSLFRRTKEMSEGDILPPWARGTPQPRTGKRGTPAWNEANRIPTLPNNRTIPSWLNASTGPANSFSSISFPSPYLLHTEPAASTAYNKYNTAYSANSHYTPSQPVGFASTPGERAKLEREQYQHDLLRQIEENNRHKLMAKQREWEQDERERLRNEIYQQRVRAEMEEEQRKMREKAENIKKKAEKLAAAQAASLEHLEKLKRNEAQQGAKKGGARDGDSVADELEWWERKDLRRKLEEQRHFPHDDEATASPGKSAINSVKDKLHRTRQLDSGEEEHKTVGRGKRSDSLAFEMEHARHARAGTKPNSHPTHRSRSSRLSYKSSMEERAREHSGSMRHLANTQKALDRERNRVKAAIDEHEYGSQIFNA